MKRLRARHKGLLGVAVLAATAAALLLPMGASAIVAGAGFTTDNPALTDACLNGPPGHSTPSVNCNIYNAKADVWLNGGPSQGQNSLTDGSYFFAVLEPSGQNDPNDGGDANLSDTDPLGGIDDSPGDTVADRTFTVSGGHVSAYAGPHTLDVLNGGALGDLIQLWPYDTTGNPGGVYILAICSLAAGYPVTPSSCKYDAFKVRNGEDPPPPPFGEISGLKYYDTNVNGQWDGGEPGIANWPINYTDGVSGTIPTDSNGQFKDSFAADTYSFTESVASGPWMQTGNTVDQSTSTGGNSVVLNADKSYTVVNVDGGSSEGINFGNICVGGGGGLTLGFWSNKNGGKILAANGNAILNAVLALNLRKANGSLLGVVNLANFQKFLLDATAVNMANMLSAQLAAMKANVLNGNVNGGALIYAPGTASANALGFATVNAVIAEANTELGLHGLALASPGTGYQYRAYQEALKNALDRANNNLNFVQPGPGSCPTPVFPS